MLKVGDKILRNLEEQVQYLTDYHKVNQGIAQWGIRIVGQVPTASQLPDAAIYGGNFGDAYAVGTSSPYDFYIWTRRSSISDEGYWFPFGEIAIVGPAGPAGKDGERGPAGESTKWYIFTSEAQIRPNIGPGVSYNAGDMGIYMGPNQTLLGEIYTLKEFESGSKQWVRNGNIRGAQGIQGVMGASPEIGTDGIYITSTNPVTGVVTNLVSLDSLKGAKGERGDVGGFINIWGILENAEQLPTPQSLDNLTVAYLVEHTGGSDVANDHYDLYIQVGETSDDALWENVGPFNAATLVTVGGEGQNVWNADTKLDKDTHTTEYNQVYVKAANGGQGHINVTKQTVADAVVQRQTDGNILVPLDPVEDADAVSKQYADTKLAKSTSISTHDQVYVKGATGNQFRKDVAVGVVGNALVERNGDGNIVVPDAPSLPNDAISKGYADDTYLKIPTDSLPGTSQCVIGLGTDGKTTYRWIANPSYIFPAALSNVIPMYRVVGTPIVNVDTAPANTLYVAQPQLPYEAANKAYVDSVAETKLTAKTEETDFSQVYQKTANGNQSVLNVTIHAEDGALVLRGNEGQIFVPYTPEEDGHASSKRYTDRVSAKYRHTVQVRLKNNTFGTDVRITLSFVSSRSNLYTQQAFMNEFVNVVDTPTTFNGSMGDVYVNGVAEGAVINSEFTCNNSAMYVKWVTITPEGAAGYHENTVDELTITTVFAPKQI